ncbi:MAG: class B sortase [Bacilli bacterium]|nr:class B sortase [Bacilli bacterium]
MKEYISLKIELNVLIFDYKTITKEQKTLVNKNSFIEDSLLYDFKYFKKNINKIIELIKRDFPDVNLIKVKRLVTFKYVADIINLLNIQCLILDFFSTVAMSDYELFLSCECLREVRCYFMSSDVKHLFNEKNIEVHMSSEVKITDKFLELHDTDSKDSLYYKKVITINEEYPELMSDLKEFLKINYKLRAINVCVYSKELIESIVNLVSNDESREVIVYLHQEYDKGNFIVNNFEWLRELSDKCKEDFTCEFRIIYSDSFVSKNLFKQLTFNNLKLVFIFGMYISVVSLVIIKSYEFVEKMSVDTLNNQLMSELKNENNNQTSVNEIVNGNTNVDETVEETLPDIEVPVEENITKEEVKSKYSFENSFNKLKKINSETKGYLVVKNTNIAYPVVQHSDNSYYLKRDFYKKKSSMGWIYMDYRNNSTELDDNTIIYGHNMGNGTMFGTLKTVLDSSWRKNADNMIVNFDLNNQSYKFKIFSIYKVDYTTDYLVTDFETADEKNDFIKMIRNRSTIKSNEVVNENSKILTLSTCTGKNNRRLVVHAVLIEEEKE